MGENEGITANIVEYYYKPKKSMFVSKKEPKE